MASQFQTPPDSAKPLAYWWWLNGHTDAATITTDLEAMRREGYGGAILMDGNGSDQGGNIGVTPGPTFGSAAWQELFLHTLKEAKRLGLRISFTTQSGWNVGGPTVTGAQSAKLLTWTRKVVHGPLKGSLQIDVPPSKNGFYRDIAVRAYPLQHGAALAGEDARKPIRNLKEKAVFVEAGFSVPDSKPLLVDFPSVANEQDLDMSQEVDLSTKKMSFAGKLEWDVPDGDWEILRIGYTSSNAKVSTSSGAFQGLVIDYLDRDALTAFWNTNVQPLLTLAKPYLGNSLEYVYTDSWEVGGVNWTGRFLLDDSTAPISVDLRKSRMMLTTEQSGHYLAVDDAGKRHVATVTEPKVLPLDKSWTIAFTPCWGAPPEVHLDKLESWSESNQEGIRHYSGTATYSGRFEIPSAFPENARVEIDLGEVRETARVSVNGKEIGVLWKRPFTVDITSVAKVGTNSLKIQVTNLWPNRLIGDQSLPEGKRLTHTNITKFKADTPLLPSGLLGPARLRITTSAAMTLEHSAH